jgi:hypothetical protein
MSDLENELRAMFAAQVAVPPPVDDPVARVLARARTARRRRVMFAGLAGAVVMVLVVGGIYLVRGEVTWPPAPAMVAAAPLTSPADTVLTTSVRLDLRVGNELWTAGGRRFALPGAGTVTWVYRVPTGWVYGDTGGELRLLETDGTPVNPDLAVDAVAVSPDGRQVAWSSGPAGQQVLVTGQLSGNGVKPTAKTPLAESAVPVTFAGSSVVLGRTDRAGRIAAYDLWDPAVAFKPSWDNHLIGVYGGTGTTLVGLVSKSTSGADGCLEFYTTATKDALSPYATGPCRLGLVAGSTRGSRSPTGQWLVDQTPQGVVFVDLAPKPSAMSGWAAATPSPATEATGVTASGTSGTAASGVGADATCAVQGRTAPVWEDDGSVLVATDLGLVRCATDGSSEVIVVPGLSGTNWDLVPALGN